MGFPRYTTYESLSQGGLMSFAPSLADAGCAMARGGTVRLPERNAQAGATGLRIVGAAANRDGGAYAAAGAACRAAAFRPARCLSP